MADFTSTTPVAALGDLSKFKGKENKFLGRGLENLELFPALAKPSEDDWLASHSEQLQSVQSWKQHTRTTISPSRINNKCIYIVPLGDEWIESTVTINKAGKKELFSALLKQFAEAFFTGFPVKLAPPVKLKQLNCRSRVNKYSKKQQLLIADLYKYLEAKKPSDAFCVVGFTMVDLYPNDKWNFVFGQAVPGRGIGVFSFARYDPSFYEDESTQVSQITPLVLWRSCKVLSHEICHLFCLKHCIYRACAMNGSNHLEEADRRPLFLCPVCLGKIKNWFQCSLFTRYQAMAEFCCRVEAECFQEALAWLENCIQMLK